MPKENSEASLRERTYLGLPEKRTTAIYCFDGVTSAPVLNLA